MTISAPLAVANGYLENLSSIIPDQAPRRVLIMNASARSLFESRLDYSLIDELRSLGFGKTFPQVIFYSKIYFKGNSFDVRVRGVDGLEEFYKENGCRINGSIPSSTSEADVGILLAKRLGIEVGDSLEIDVDGRRSRIEVAGIVDCRCPCDDEVLFTLGDAWRIKPSLESKITLIEVTSIQNANLNALSMKRVKPLAEEPFHEAVGEIIWRTFDSIRNWSAPMYFLILAAMYFVASKISSDSERDLMILRCIGASRGKALAYVFYRSLIVAVLAMVVGLALGLVSAQIIFRLLAVMFSAESYIPPSLGVLDVAHLIALSTLSAVAGIIHPALKASRMELGEAAWRLAYR